jgi:hypothetical protein
MHKRDNKSSGWSIYRDIDKVQRQQHVIKIDMAIVIRTRGSVEKFSYSLSAV